MALEKLTRQSATRILDETIEFYKVNRFSRDSTDQCLYQGPDGTLCAFARILTPEDRQKLQEGQNANAFAEKIGFDDTDGRFYNQIQRLHDGIMFWEGDRIGVALSPAGEKHVETIRSFIEGNYPA